MRIFLPAPGSGLPVFRRRLLALILCSCTVPFSALHAQGTFQQVAPDNAAQNQSPDVGPGPDTPTGATENGGITFQTFYDSLSSLGTWIKTDNYGYVWQPKVIDPNWAPYTAGHWAYSDDGWTWVTDEPWGWATYHYGRWTNLEGTGWVWVPGYTWAPAWVSWRYGGDTVGWAPLPPESMVGVDYSSDDSSSNDGGFHVGSDSDDYYGIGPAYYIFLPIGFLCYRDYRGHYCDHHDNYWRINHTHNVTDLNVARNGTRHDGGSPRVTLGGPKLEDVNAASQTPIQRTPLVRTNQAGAGALTQNSLSVYAPRVVASTTARPAQVGMAVGQAQMNRGADIAHPLVVNAQLAPAPATDSQIQQARIAQTQAPGEAKVLTDASNVRPVVPMPMTSLHPIGGNSAQGANGRPSPAANQPGVQQPVFAAPSQVYPHISEEQVLNRVSHADPGYSSAPPIETIRMTTNPQTGSSETPRRVVAGGASAAGGTSGGGATTHVYSPPSTSTSGGVGTLHETSGAAGASSGIYPSSGSSGGYQSSGSPGVIVAPARSH